MDTLIINTSVKHTVKHIVKDIKKTFTIQPSEEFSDTVGTVVYDIGTCAFWGFIILVAAALIYTIFESFRSL